MITSQTRSHHKYMLDQITSTHTPQIDHKHLCIIRISKKCQTYDYITNRPYTYIINISQTHIHYEQNTSTPSPSEALGLLLRSIHWRSLISARWSLPHHWGISPNKHGEKICNWPDLKSWDPKLRYKVSIFLCNSFLKWTDRTGPKLAITLGGSSL